MKRIQSKQDFLAWANEINRGVSLSRKCELQDVYGHSTVAEIDQAFIDADGDRALIICSVTNNQSFGEVERLLKVLAKHKVNELLKQEQDELDKSWKEVAKEKSEVAEMQNRIDYLETRIGVYQSEVTRINQLACEYKIKSEEYKTKAEKFDALKAILA